MLAAFATVFCIVPILLIAYGKRMRAASKFARDNMPSEEFEELKRVKTVKEVRKKEERDAMREREDAAMTQGVDLGALAVVPYF